MASVWRKAISPLLSGEGLFWVVGENAPTASKQLSAVLSEIGLANRWVPLSQRPAWIQEVLHLPWAETHLARLLKEVPFLVLDAQSEGLLSLYRALVAQQLVQAFFLPSYLKSPLTVEPVSARTADQLQAWAAMYEELAPDLRLAESWLPCTLTGKLS